MNCKYCGNVIRVDPNWYGGQPAYTGGENLSYCKYAPIGPNPLGGTPGNWHTPDNGLKAVTEILNKYSNA